MDKYINLPKAVMSIIVALISGAILTIALPLVGLFALDVLVSFAALLDPLHQGKVVEAVWDAFGLIVFLQIVFPVVASIINGILISALTHRFNTGWMYLAGAAISLVIYCFCQFVSVICVGLFAHELIVFSWLVISLAVVGISSPLIGLILVWVNRVWAKRR